MTNAEKYEAVFGFMPDLDCCPTDSPNCEGCPAEEYKSLCCRRWWLSEYDDQTPINTEGDLISRKELIKALDGRANWLGQMSLENLVALNFYSLVNSMPSAGAFLNGIEARPIAKWEPEGRSYGEYYFSCTNCKEDEAVPTVFGKPVYNFCPNCGAEMREEAENE